MEIPISHPREEYTAFLDFVFKVSVIAWRFNYCLGIFLGF